MLRNIHVQYPKIVYGFGMNEVWVQDLKSNIRQFRFDWPIASFENCSKACETNYDNDVKIGLAFDHGDFFTVSRLEITRHNEILFTLRKRFYKEMLSKGKFKNFFFIKVQNQEKKTAEDAILFHMKDTLIIQSLTTESIKVEIKRKLNKCNIIALEDKSALFFWDCQGIKIEKMYLPLDLSQPELLFKAYEADDYLRIAKTTVIENEEYLLVIDEMKHVKILKNEKKRLTIFKDLYVDANFGINN